MKTLFAGGEVKKYKFWAILLTEVSIGSYTTSCSSTLTTLFAELLLAIVGLDLLCLKVLLSTVKSSLLSFHLLSLSFYIRYK